MQQNNCVPVMRRFLLPFAIVRPQAVDNDMCNKNELIYKSIPGHDTTAITLTTDGWYRHAWCR